MSPGSGSGTGQRRALAGRAPPRQAGVSLLEALVAAAVLALGLHGALRLGWLGQHMGHDTAELLQAYPLALQALECDAAGGDGCVDEQEVLMQGTRYRLSLTRQDGPSPGMQRLLATVQWQGAFAQSSLTTPALSPPATSPPAISPPASPAPAARQVQLWREVAQVPRWHGVSSP